MTALTLSPNTFPLALGSASAESGSELGSSEQRFLRCPLLGWDAMLIPLESVLEVFPLAVEGLLAVPEMPDCVMGTLNRRGEFLWVVDLQVRLGASPLSMSGSQSWMGIALSAAGRSLAVAVPEIGDIEAHAADQIQPVPPGLFPSNLQTFVAGYLLDPLGSTRVILSPEALVLDPA